MNTQFIPDDYHSSEPSFDYASGELSLNSYSATKKLYTLSVSPAYRYDDGKWAPLILDIIIYELDRSGGGVIIISEWDFQRYADEHGELPPIEINLFSENPSVDLNQVKVKLQGIYKGALVAFEPVEDDDPDFQPFSVNAGDAGGLSGRVISMHHKPLDQEAA